MVCSGKDLVDLWVGPLLCGPNPTSQYGLGSDNSFCEPGLPRYLIRHLQKCKLFSRNHSGRKLGRYYSFLKLEGMWILSNHKLNNLIPRTDVSINYQLGNDRKIHVPNFCT